MGPGRPPETAATSAPRDWRSPYERERARADREQARADAAETRCEELRWAEVDSRARAGSLKWQLDKSRSKLKAAVEETKAIRRPAKTALALQSEVAGLRKLLFEAGIEAATCGTIVSPLMEVARPRKIVPASAAREGTTGPRSGEAPSGARHPRSNPRARRTRPNRCARNLAGCARRTLNS